MGTDEINAQAGSALRAYQDAKVALAQSENRLAKLADLYEKAARALRAHKGDEFTNAPTVIKNMGGLGEGEDVYLYLPDGATAITQILEHENKRKTVATTLATLRSLGFDVL